MNAAMGMVFDRVRLYKQIGLHPDHMELRRRVEERLAAMKSAGRLTEDRNAPTFNATSGDECPNVEFRTDH
jgi:hypothetical protein